MGLTHVSFAFLEVMACSLQAMSGQEPQQQT